MYRLVHYPKITKMIIIHVTILVGYFYVPRRIRYCTPRKKTVCFSTKSPLPSPLTPNPHTTHNPSQYHCPLLLLLPPAPTMTNVYHYNTNVTMVYPNEDNGNQLTRLIQNTRHQTFLTLPAKSRTGRLVALDQRPLRYSSSTSSSQQV